MKPKKELLVVYKKKRNNNLPAEKPALKPTEPIKPIYVAKPRKPKESYAESYGY